MDIPTGETPEDVDRLLTQARKALQDFEHGVDRKRLLLRLRTASPAHPVLLARFLFGGLGVLCLMAAVVVMVITMVNNDLARELAKFEMVIPYVPEEVPALPALLGALGLCMAFAWTMATFAALSLGRDATMLPWEQKQHQKLVNEVTKLTTQKAVMERIRSTPAGARPRIATPVPVSGRRMTPGGAGAGAPGSSTSALARGGFSRGTIPAGSPSYASPPGPKATPSGAHTYSAIATPAPAIGAPTVTPFGAPAPGGFGPRTSGIAHRPAAAGAGGFAPVAVEPSGYSAPTTTTPSNAPPPGYDPPNGSGGHAWGESDDVADPEEEPPTPHVGGVRLGKAGGVRLGSRQPAQRQPQLEEDLADLVDVGEDTSPIDEEEPTDGPDTAGGGGILGRARAGGVQMRSTPFGSAGRVRPPPAAGARSAREGPPTAPTVSAPAPVRHAPSTRGGTPLGAAPKAGVSVAKGATRVSPPVFPGTPERAERHEDRRGPRLPASAFGTPTPFPRSSQPPTATAAVRTDEPDLSVEEEVSVMEEEAQEAPSSGTRTETIVRNFPRFEHVSDAWLGDAIRKAEALQRTFPMQAYLAFNQEPNLPFTLVIARATPAMAVRAMVSFVEYLAGIATPVRARIELVNVNHLDRSFHKNVEAALEPYFGGNFEVEPEPGRVDIRFTDPDPQWGDYPNLPIVDE